MPATTHKIDIGDRLAEREFHTITGATVHLPAPDRITHLQFRRYATCPLCNLHLRTITQRHDEILAAGIREIVVFHSPADELLEYQAELPFAVIADPDKHLYRDFGVEAAPRALLNHACGSPPSAPPSAPASSRRPRPTAASSASPPTSSSRPTTPCSPASTAPTPTTSGQSTNSSTTPGYLDRWTLLA